MSLSSHGTSLVATPDASTKTGPYVLHSLLENIQLSKDGEDEDAQITCVEHWNENLYVGTSEGEILHYVRLPEVENEIKSQADFILASRLQPVYTETSDPTLSNSGIQQIQILPSASKACVLCNGTLTFYTLPELTPAFGNAKLPNCSWVGGVSLSLTTEADDNDAVEIMICLKRLMRIVKIGETSRKVREFEIGACLATVRRDDIACIADAHSYSLLDVAERQKVPLFDIVSNAAPTQPPETPKLESDPSLEPFGHARRASASSAIANKSPDRGHSRSASSGTMLQRASESHLDIPGAKSEQSQESVGTRSASPREGSPEKLAERDRSVSPARVSSGTSPAPQAATSKPEENLSQKPSSPAPTLLRPHILSPTPGEFLLTTGTTYDDPGVGMFVSMDGDLVSRGTIDFTRYPKAIAVDGKGVDSSVIASPGEVIEEGFVLAVMERTFDDVARTGLEIQRWDLDPGEGGGTKDWVDVFPSIGLENQSKVGIRQVISPNNVHIPEIASMLGMKRARLNDRAQDENNEQDHTEPETGGREFVNRLSSSESNVLVWRQDCIWSAVRNPLAVRLDSRLKLALTAPKANDAQFINRQAVEQVLNEIRGRDPGSELEYMTIQYIRQKGSLLLMMDLISRAQSNQTTYDRDRRVTEEALTAGEIDPRIVLSLFPTLREEIIIGRKGIWLQGGLEQILEQFLQRYPAPDQVDVLKLLGSDNLSLAKRYLMIWRGKKGLESVADKNEVFQSVDAALLLVLLTLDRDSPRGPATRGSVRGELNVLVDKGVDCFERAVQLLEQFKRLYVLSRLYQSRKLSAQVLTTWRRILEGEEDSGGEFVDGENELRRYLSYIRDRELVEEYATWLANRNPQLGIRVFAEDSSKVRFEPKNVVQILKSRAPGAVKVYLEHLVFVKHLPQYASDLISHYFDSVITELNNSPASREILISSYDDYRALPLPKPTYSQFALDLAIPDTWWQNRLRLLQLLGGSHGATDDYDDTAILARLEPFEKELVPELIILYGRQERHKEAIRLLVHSLRDYDTAVRYCVLGGASTYSYSSSAVPAASIPTRDQQADLFNALLEEFFRIEDVNARVTQTSELLERFAGWFDVGHVLDLVPDDWSVELVRRFLESAFRSLVSERNDTAVAKALTSAQNLNLSAKVVETLDKMGAEVQVEDVS